MESFTFALLVDAALKGTLVLLAATGLVLILRRGSAARRHLVWQMAVLAVLCLPLVGNLARDAARLHPSTEMDRHLLQSVRSTADIGATR